MATATKDRVPVAIVLAVQLAEQGHVLHEAGLDNTPTFKHADELFGFATSRQAQL